LQRAIAPGSRLTHRCDAQAEEADEYDDSDDDSDAASARELSVATPELTPWQTDVAARVSALLARLAKQDTTAAAKRAVALRQAEEAEAEDSDDDDAAAEDQPPRLAASRARPAEGSETAPLGVSARRSERGADGVRSSAVQRGSAAESEEQATLREQAQVEAAAIDRLFQDALARTATERTAKRSKVQQRRRRSSEAAL